MASQCYFDYLSFWHPDGGSLLFFNEVGEFWVPLTLCRNASQVEGTGVDVGPKFLKLLALLEQLFGWEVGFPERQRKCLKRVVVVTDNVKNKIEYNRNEAVR